MINCRKYTRYLHKSEVTELKWYEKLLMKYHYVICKLCKQYTSENNTLNEILFKQKASFFFSESEAEQYKNALIQKLKL